MRTAGRSDLGEAGLSVLEHGLNLFAIYAGEPLKKFSHRGSTFEILKECFYGNARADEKPSPADFAGNPLHRRAL